MATVSASDRSTQLAMHTLGAALALASTRPSVSLDLDGLPEVPAPARARAVEGRVREVMADLEAVIRAQRIGPTAVPPAVLGRRMVEDRESYDAVNRAYTSGPAFDVFVKALCVDADARDHR